MNTLDPFKKNPYVKIIQELDDLFKNSSDLRKQFDAAIAAVKDLPPAPGQDKPTPNIWKNRTYTDFCNYFNNWYSFIPTPTSGLGYIEPFTTFYYDNDKAFYFLNKIKIIFDWTVKFIVERGKFMDMPDVAAKEINQWMQDPQTHIRDFVIPNEGYQTFNEFFTRQLRPGARPIAAVDDDSVVVSPADSELNMINSILAENSKIKTKGNQKLGVKDLLNSYADWKDFLYGTALSCVLLPTDYHHYHAPVTGQLIHSEIVPGIFFGVEDAPMWFHQGNVGDSDADFSIFEQFHRGVFIFQTKSFGNVAMVAVGLNTISGIGFEMNSVNFLKQYINASPETPVEVFKGDLLGYFKYGGSLTMLLFEKDVFQGIKVHQGDRIGTLTSVKK